MSQIRTPVREVSGERVDGCYVLSAGRIDYADGSEDRLFDIVSSSTSLDSLSDDLEAAARTWPERYHLSKRRCCLLRPFALPANARVLEIGAGCGALTRYLGERCGIVDALEPVMSRARVARARTRDLENVEVFVGTLDDVPEQEAYDLVLLIGVFEYVGRGSPDRAVYQSYLRRVAALLAPGGQVLCAIENRLGVKYLAGAPEDHSLKPFQGVDGYPEGSEARTFTRAELGATFSAAGLTSAFVSAFPDYKMPRVLLSDALLSHANVRPLAWRLPQFPSPDWERRRPSIASEARLWQTFVEDGVAPGFANSFVVTAAKQERPKLWPDDVLAVYNTGHRRSLFAVETTVREAGGRVMFERQLMAGGTSNEEGDLRLVLNDAPHVPGDGLVDAIGTGVDHRPLLMRWRQAVEAEERRNGLFDIDLVPSNVVVSGKDLWFVDREWRHKSLGSQDAVERGLMWLARDLANDTPPSRWRGSTVGNLALELGSVVGLDPTSGWLDRTARREAELQAQIVDASPSDRRWVAAVADQRRWIDGDLRRPLDQCDLGERIWETRDALVARVSRLEAVVNAGELARASAAAQRRDMESGLAWALVGRLRALRARVLPEGTYRYRVLATVKRAVRGWSNYGPKGFAKVAVYRVRLRLPIGRVAPRDVAGDAVVAEPVSRAAAGVSPHTASVEIIVPVHNALGEVERCIESIARWTSQPYRLVLIDDGSDEETARFLSKAAARLQASLLRNDLAAGYTRAVNRALAEREGDYVVLLNSDAVVTPEWLDRMIACAESDDRIGMVGPLSNAASWQSVPEIELDGDWHPNPLPPGLDIDGTARAIATLSSRVYPPMPFLNGFCLLIRAPMIDELGLFDEENFGEGYGEENDYALRATAAGWKLCLADDVYVYHAQSRSYSHERRMALSGRAMTRLVAKHGPGPIDRGVAFSRSSPILQGIRARARVLPERIHLRAEGRLRFEGRRLLFVLPVREPGGGANVVFTEARAMREMGVSVEFFNLARNRVLFEATYSDVGFPILWGVPADLPTLANRFDGIVATAHQSVDWVAKIERTDVARGYYVQDFEPYFYPQGSEDYRRAWDSYTSVPDMRLFTKTTWNRLEVKRNTSAECTEVGPSVDIDLFQPRARDVREDRGRTRVAAMIRPSSAHRQAEATLEVLRDVSRTFAGEIDFLFFGYDVGTTSTDGLLRTLPHTSFGVLPPERLASLLAQADVFVDFSSYQAMGLTAMEAMSCGAAVIVPSMGGAAAFARHEENAIVVDTLSREECVDALSRLVASPQLQRDLGGQALVDACQFFPERAASNVLFALFGG